MRCGLVHCSRGVVGLCHRFHQLVRSVELILLGVGGQQLGEGVFDSLGAVAQLSSQGLIQGFDAESPVSLEQLLECAQNGLEIVAMASHRFCRSLAFGL